MKRKLTALLAALCITAVLPVHAGAVDLPLTSRAARRTPFVLPRRRRPVRAPRSA